MGLREMVRIDEEKCDGCGLCIPACAEGALQIIDGKARLVDEVFCDGMGACLGHCPQDAIVVEQLDAKPFDEAAVAKHLAALSGGNGGNGGNGGHRAQPAAPPRPAPLARSHGPHAGGGCPGARTLQFDAADAGAEAGDSTGARPSQLRQWPVQMHLVSPHAPYFQGADVLLAADCVAFALGDFHRDHLKGRGLAIACPKLDVEQQIYEDKLVAMIDEAKINTLTVMVMEVPCCSGLLRTAQSAAARAQRKVPIKMVMVGVRGDLLAEEWL